MLELLNVNNPKQLAVKVKYGNKSPIEFTIGSIINKKNKHDLIDNQPFILLNNYINYKGDGFKEELYDRYQESFNDIVETMDDKTILPLPTEITTGVLDMFDIMDIFHYFKNIYRIQPPKSLMDSFDSKAEAVDRKSRVQTFLKDDYLELISLAMVIKAVIGPLGEYAELKASEINSSQKDYILFDFVRSHHVYDSYIMQKVKGMINKIMEKNNSENAENESIRVIENKIPRDELDSYLLAIVMLQRVTTAPIIKDNDTGNLVTSIYSYVTNKCVPNKGTSNTIRAKKQLTDPESGEEESMPDSYRLSTDHTAGDIVMMQWAVSDVNKLANDMPLSFKKNSGYVYVDREVFTDAMQFTKRIKYLDETQLNLLGIIFKLILDPRMLEHIKLEGIVNLTTVGFTYLWGMGYKNLAILLCSRIYEQDRDHVSFNQTTNKSRIPKELKDELDILFPYKRKINKDKWANVVEEDIHTIANEMYDTKWVPYVNDKYVEEGLENGDIGNILPQDLKIQLASFMIDHEKLIERINNDTR